MKFFSFLLAGILCQQAQAVIDHTIHHSWISTRALGMGDAFIAVADDYNALFYNPAGLARLKEKQLNLFVGGAMDNKVYGFYKDIDSATKSRNNTTEITNLISSSYGQHYAFRAPELGGVWAKPRWAVGLIPMDLSVDIDIHQQVGPSLNVIAMQDATLAVGHGWDVKWNKDHISFGVTARAVYRLYYAQAVLAPQLALEKQVFRKENANEGVGGDVDLGALWSPNLNGSWFNFMRKTEPTFGLVVRNAADQGFPLKTKLLNKDSASATPPIDQRRIDVGSKIDLPSFWVFKPRLALDDRDILHKNYSLRKGFHVGLELPWKMYSWWQGGWRIGFNQGYWTAGFSGTLGIFTLDIATWGEDVGTQEVPQESRRYMARASLDF